MGSSRSFHRDSSRLLQLVHSIFSPSESWISSVYAAFTKRGRASHMAMTSGERDLQISLLRTFVAVVRHGSINRTAAAVSMTQPAVSQQMIRLENVIGRKLLYRHPGGVRPTTHGELLLAYANRALGLHERALARLREESVSRPGRFGVSGKAGTRPQHARRAGR
jgi:molybdenum-dependent DNA-binding transcriptional regulator ModE